MPGPSAELLDRWVAVAGPTWEPTTYGNLLRRGRADGSSLSPSRVRRIHGVLHRAFTQAVKWGWVWVNPVSTASPPRELPAEVHPPTAEAVRTLLASVRDVDPELFTFLHLGASTGARRSQLLGLRWGEVDFARSAVGFARAFVEGVDGPVLRATKNRHSYRVAIDSGTLGVLVDHWRRSVVAAARGGVGLTVESFVFSRDCDGGRPWLPNHVTKRFIVHRRRAGLAEFRLHDLRHFMATEMLAHGVPVPTVSQRLGHARASTTLNVYAHRVPGADREAATFVGALLDPNVGPATMS